MSRMSHELRTPLNSVLGFAQILEMELQSPDELEMVSYIHNSGKYLLELINEVLDISRIESGHISVMIEPIVLQDLEKECIKLVTPQANEFGVTIFSQSDYDFQVLGDQQRLKQVMLNLLSNAIKYNRPNGSVTISCAPRPRSRVRLSVVDTGPGINPDLLEPSLHALRPTRRRDLGYRRDRSRTRALQGSHGSHRRHHRRREHGRAVVPRSGSSCRTSRRRRPPRRAPRRRSRSRRPAKRPRRCSTSKTTSRTSNSSSDS